MSHWKMIASLMIGLFLAPNLRGEMYSGLIGKLSSDQIEQIFLKKLPEVRRIEKKLIIPAGGKKIIFEDNASDGTSGRTCRLVGFFHPHGQTQDYLVREGYYEGAEFVLVNGRTGRLMRMLGEPTLSPGSGLYSSAFTNEALASPQTGVIIFRSYDFVPEFTWRPIKNNDRLGGTADSLWVSDRELLVLDYTIDAQGQMAKRPVRFVKEGDAWTGPFPMK